jgi:hypothetical protein
MSPFVFQQFIKATQLLLKIKCLADLVLCEVAHNLVLCATLHEQRLILSR